MAQMHRDDKGICKQTNDLRMDELAYSAIIKELKRGNGRVALAWLTERARIRPDTQPSTGLVSTIHDLLPPVDNVSVPLSDNEQASPPQSTHTEGQEPSKQPKSPSEHVELPVQPQFFGDPGLTSPAHPPDSAVVESDNAHPSRPATEPVQFEEDDDE